MAEIASICSPTVSSPTTLTPDCLGRLGDELIDVRQIERLPRRLALRDRRQHRQEPELEVVGEFAGIALSGEQLFDVRAVRRRRVLERVVLAVERPGQHGRAGVRLFDGVHRTAELRRHDLGAGDPLGRAARQRDRRFVGRMDRAVKVGRLQSRPGRSARRRRPR